jgi:hypothetical protein
MPNQQTPIFEMAIGKWNKAFITEPSCSNQARQPFPTFPGRHTPVLIRVEELPVAFSKGVFFGGGTAPPQPHFLLNTIT